MTKPKAKNTQKPRGKPGRVKILVLCVFLLVCSVGNSVTFKMMVNVMPNYPYFLNLSTVVVYVPIFFGVVFYNRYFTNIITAEMMKTPKLHFALMGGLDSTAGLLALFGGVYTSGPNQAMLNNGVIPVTLLLSIIILGTHFKWQEYVGSGVILLGLCFVLLVPQWLGGSDAPPATNKVLFNMLYFANVVPAAMSAVCKEMMFTKGDIDVNFLQAWVALWQFLFSLLFLPFNTLPFLGANALPWAKLPSALSDGASCLFLEHNTVVENCWIDYPRSDRQPCDSCHGAWIAVAVYLVFNVLYNIAIVMVIKHGSAALLFVVSTLALPVVQMLFSLPFLGTHAEPLTWPTLVGLLILIGGLVLYRQAPQAPMSVDEEDVVIPTAGRYVVSAQKPIRRKVMAHMRRDAHQIRSRFYATIGVLDSPSTSRSMRPASRQGSVHSPGPPRTPQTTAPSTPSRSRRPAGQSTLRPPRRTSQPLLSLVGDSSDGNRSDQNQSS